ncbi:hypothetical protein BJY04DRAFT_223139 [Aspergillus karnatakaensis]|uniref:uncharacterized protein n=1 Tax=Aspergillus karnatakaensis TaxID=1810916 RepID=UPI003CCCCAAF
MLSTLPNEILIQIAASLDLQHDKLNLARCNRQFYDLLLPEAYKSLHLSYDCKWALSCLAHALIRKPRLAISVRSLCLVDKPCNHRAKLRFNRSLISSRLPRIAATKEEIKSWENTLQGKSLEEGDMHFGQAEAWRTFLSILVPKLESLHQEWGVNTDLRNQAMQRISLRQKPFDTHRPLSCLREVNISIAETEFGVDLFDILPFFRLPSMRRVTCLFVMDLQEEDDNSSDKSSGVESDAFPVTDIALYWSHSQSVFKKLIRGCAKLESFVYESGYLEAMEHLTPVIKHDALYQELRKHKGTLNVLEVYENDPFSLDHNDPTLVCSFGPMRDFSALTRLRLDTRGLLGDMSGSLVDILPPRLASLTIDAFNRCPNIVKFAGQVEDILQGRKVSGSAGSMRFANWACLHVRGCFTDEKKWDAYYKGKTANILLKHLVPAASLLDRVCTDGRLTFTMWCDGLNFAEGDWVPRHCYRFPGLFTQFPVN